MEWLLLGVLGIIWAAVLIPTRGRQMSPTTQIAAFEKDMDLLAESEGRRRRMATAGGISPANAKARERTKVLERRRQVLAFLVEATVVTFLIGLVPPLHSMWIVTSGFSVVLFGYVWMLVRLKTIEDGGHGVAQQRAADHRVGAVARGDAAGQRFVADRTGLLARASYAGLKTFSEDDVHVVVHPRD
jgi:hypothetical protein